MLVNERKIYEEIVGQIRVFVLVACCCMTAATGVGLSAFIQTMDDVALEEDSMLVSNDICIQACIDQQPTEYESLLEKKEHCVKTFNECYLIKYDDPRSLFRSRVKNIGYSNLPL